MHSYSSSKIRQNLADLVEFGKNTDIGYWCLSSKN
jgi:hypothetical protein